MISALSIEYMSSEVEEDSENDTVYKVKSLPWRSDEYNGVVKELDRKATSLKSKRGKRMEVPRRPGTVSNRPAPKNVPDQNMWF